MKETLRNYFSCRVTTAAYITRMSRVERSLTLINNIQLIYSQSFTHEIVATPKKWLWLFHCQWVFQDRISKFELYTVPVAVCCDNEVPSITVFHKKYIQLCFILSYRHSDSKKFLKSSYSRRFTFSSLRRHIARLFTKHPKNKSCLNSSALHTRLYSSKLELLFHTVDMSKFTVFS